MGIPVVQTGDRNITQLQQNIIGALNPLLNNVLANGLLLQSVSLSIGNNTIEHGLSQTLTGWYVTRMRKAYSQIYDLQDTNTSPSTTLLLNSSIAVVVDIYVF